MNIRLNIKTPANQAHRCINTLKIQLVGLKGSKKIIKEAITSHKSFYWILKIDDEKELKQITYKAAMGEVTIKKFYRSLFKLLNKANKLAKKFQKGAEWIKRWIRKTARKRFGEGSEALTKIEEMSDEEITDYIKIDDEEEMREFLDNEIISIKTE